MIHVFMPLVITGFESQNIFDTELIHHLSRNDCYVETGTWQFEYPPRNWDIIHLHWPEHIIAHPLSKQNVDCLISWLKLSKCNSKIVWTVHNIKPHSASQPELHAYLYHEVATLVDHFVHLGPRSIPLFKRLYNVNPSIPSKIISHGLYSRLNRFPEDPSKSFFHTNKTVILSVGAIRTREELLLLLYVWFLLDKQRFTLVIAGHVSALNPYELFTLRSFVSLILRYLLQSLPGLVLYCKSIDTRTLSLFCKSSHVLLIPRFNVTNSGGLYLGETFDLDIIGPDSGNPGYFLNRLGYFTFAPSSPSSAAIQITKVIVQSVSLRSKACKITQNRRNLFKSLCCWNRIALKHRQLYSRLLIDATS